MKRNSCIFFGLYLCLLSSTAGALENALQNHPSPYLAMHGNDPVHWQDWGEDTLALARQQDKLIFISSGYFSCHWCHVMQRESYQDSEIAKLLNDNFISVKIDRELLSALDEHLIDFLRRTEGHAGWPLNVFLTPDGYPLVGMTYVPTENFKTLLGRLTDLWSRNREASRDTARKALHAIVQQRLSEQAAEDGVVISEAQLRERLVQEIKQYGDEFEGGFGTQNRFPMAPQLLMILELQARQADEFLSRFLQLTLDQMASLGLRDHLAGGFYRYTVDPGWRVPHFEKMLYTQALLAQVYLRAGELFNRTDYLAVAINTLDFVLDEMAGPQGGYIASFSAVDDQGREGGYYLWNEQQLQAVLSGSELELANVYWQLSGGSSEDGGLPIRESTAHKMEQMGDDEKAIERIRIKLLKHRKGRLLPADKKELAGWNGLLLAALSEAAMLLDNSRYQQAADRLQQFLKSKLLANDGRLIRARQGDQKLGAAALEDYAFVAYGFHQWATLTRRQADTAVRNKILHAAWKGFYSDQGWHSADRALLPGMAKAHIQDDGALISPAALIIRLSLLSNDKKLQQKAAKALAATRPGVQKEPFWHASHVLELLRNPDITHTRAVEQ